jgi:threonine dehydrogenase-like Zn-dependent dehydrogenase
VRLQIVASGICGTDLHMYQRKLPVLPGNTPGHEMVGFPTDGPGGLAERLYAVEPHRLWCGVCALCLSGDRHLCPEKKIFGLHVPGGLAESIDVPRENLHPVDASVSPLVASLAEPLSVATRALNRARLETSSHVLVLGSGSIGLLAGLLARERSMRVGITARHPHQRRAAERLGLDPLEEDDARRWAEEFAPDVVIESVGGTAETLGDAVDLCGASGRVVVLGVFAGERSVNAFRLMERELTLIGSNTYGSTRHGSEFRSGVELLARHRSELATLLTHQFPLTSIVEAFSCAEDKSSGAIKVTVLPAN